MSKSTEQFGAEIAAALRAISPDGKLWDADVGPLNQLADSFWRRQPAEPSSGRKTSPKGIALMHSFESCRLTAYPDPGSRNGEPWTVGWGSTGPDIKRGTVWTQAQADERFAADLGKFERKVSAAIGDAPTTQNQFDAFVCLAYNIGADAFAGSTVCRRHKAGDHKGAAGAFGMWVKNDGKVMNGLVRRRAAEAALYRGQA